MKTLNWLLNNIGLLVLAIFLALIIWITAQYTNDPNEERTTRPLKLEKTGLAPGYIITNDYSQDARITLRAPSSIWEQIENDPKLLQPFIDLSTAKEGINKNIKVDLTIDEDIESVIKVVKIDPENVEIVLDESIKEQFPIEAIVSGELPLGYEKGELTLEPEVVTISGPKSALNQIDRVQVNLDISGRTENINSSLPLNVLNPEGGNVDEISLSPPETTAILPISLLGGFKNVVVKVNTTGQIAEGYRLTNVSVTPPTITVFSEDPRMVEDLPGFVDTQPVDLSGLIDDSEFSIGLRLPEGITPVRDPKVLVQVSIAAMEGSETFSVPIEIRGLSPELSATFSPELVEVIVAGPLNILETLTADDIKVVLDLEGQPPGEYQRAPKVEIISDLVRASTTIPETVEVIIETAPTPELTATVTITPSP
ncbi:MAG: YbbR-like domain-containing protein [Anaerolineales bacterium]|jgi:YbbR domain-containing protein